MNSHEDWRVPSNPPLQGRTGAAATRHPQQRENAAPTLRRKHNKTNTQKNKIKCKLFQELPWEHFSAGKGLENLLPSPQGKFFIRQQNCEVFQSDFGNPMIPKLLIFGQKNPK